jgi:FtsX-like permease family
LLLFKRPSVFLSVLGTAAILSVVAALTPLFLSSASSAALQRELEGRCPASFAGTTTMFGATSPTAPAQQPSLAHLLNGNRATLAAEAATNPSLLAPVITIKGTVVNVERNGPPLTGRFLARDDFRDHIELIEGEDGPGAYIDDVMARDLELGPGDEMVFSAGGKPGVVPIQAIYKGVYDQLADPYWCSDEDVLAINSMGDLPPSPILVDPLFFDYDHELMTAVYAGYGNTAATWMIPVDLEGLTVSQAADVAATFDALDEIVTDQGDPIFYFGGRPGLHSDITMVSNRVQALSAALRTSIFPLAGIVLLAALALIGAAGSYWVDRRRLELEYLSSKGAGPGSISIKAVLEFLPAMLAGSALGWAGANLMIGMIGPSPDIESYARVQAFWVTLAAVCLGLLAVAAVVGLRARGLLDRKPEHGRRLTLRIPLLLVAVIGAILVRTRIGDNAVILGENDLVGSVDPLVLLYPLFVFLSVVLLFAEVVIRLFPVIRRIGARSHAAYLASRRVVSTPTLVVALIAGAALPVATLIYAATLTRSATSTIDAKGRTFIGADVATPVFGLIDPPGDLAAVSTVVVKVERASLNGEIVDLLAIDHATFPRGAFWESSYASQPLQEILDTLSDEDTGGRIPAYSTNGSLDSGNLTSGAGDVDVEIVGSLDSFPGARGSRPLVIVDRRRFVEAVGQEGERVPGARYLMWTMDRSSDEIESQMAAAGIGYSYTIEAATTLDQLKFRAIVWTFDFLEIFAALGGLIALGGVLLYVDTRQRQRNLSYALARRMGLRRSEHLMAGFFEIGGLSIMGVAAGLIAAQIGARSLYRILDAVPGTPPGPRWVGALDLTVLAFVAAALIGGLAALMAQRTADNSDTSELLRHGE